MKKYVPMHVHTSDGSIGDSILKLDEYINKAKELDLTSLAITEHGTLTSMYAFIKTCKDNNIKPIIGCEIYEVEDKFMFHGLEDSAVKEIKKDKTIRNNYGHLILIAKNNNGLKNLLEIVNYSQLKGMYYKPRISLEKMKKYSKDIICLTACVGGKVPKFILNDEIDKAKEHLLKYTDVFDEVYLEIQPGDFDEQIVVNNTLIEFSRELNIPLVATNDVHYLDAEDYYIHDIHCKLDRKINLIKDEHNEVDLLYPDKCYYLKSYDDLVSSFTDCPKDIVLEAVSNTLLIDSKCEDIVLVEDVFMPIVDLDNRSAEEELKHIATKELNLMVNSVINPAIYATRVAYELDVLNKTGYAPYFLIVKDFLDEARRRGIEVGPGRGSIAGSLVAFLIGIIDVDPIKYDLPFERFHSIYRVGSLPDIDSDFCSERRQEMFDYILEKYGIDKCSLVSTKLVRKARTALKDSGRYLGYDDKLMNEVAKLIPEVFYDDDGEKTTEIPIGDAIQISKDLKEFYKDNKELFHIAMKLENITKSSSIHAAGTLIAPINLSNYIPLRQSDKNIYASALTLEDAEIANLLKFDILGVATLSVINKTKVTTNDVFDIRYNEYDEDGIWNLIGSCNTTGLFQISSRTYKSRMGRIKPRSIKELAICLALLRGPCISCGFDKDYIEILEGIKEREYIHQVYDEATDETHGILVFQEQLMKICQNVGFSTEESYRIMKIVAKKKIDKIKEYETEFTHKSKDLGIDDSTIAKIWHLIVNAGAYLFNKGHAISYALVCYMSAYYKYHYPAIYMSYFLTNVYLHGSGKDKELKIAEGIHECRRVGISFLPVCLNHSKTEFTVEDEYTIRIGYCAVKCLSVNAMKVFSNNYIHDIDELIDSNIYSLKKNEIVPIIAANACLEFGDRTEILQKYFTNRKDELDPTCVTLHASVKIDLTKKESEIEQTILGTETPYINTPVNNFKSINFNNKKKGDTINIKVIVTKSSKKIDKFKKEMNISNCDTADGLLKIVTFSKQFEQYRSLLKKNKLLNIYGTKDNDNSIIVRSIEELNIV